MKKILIFTIFFLLLTTDEASARADLSLTATDITFSKDEPLAGEKVRVFARVFNVGDNDVYGFVVFLLNGREIADPQPISVKVNTYDDVFIDWTFEAGKHQLTTKIVATRPPDENLTNDSVIRENYLVDLDTDQDKIGNLKDLDDDNDGLLDEREIVLGTSPLNPDSDGDKAKDNIDPFPLDAKEWQDSDNDGLGNNQDTDDDNDGLSDEEELFVFGTNPLNQDTDQDLVSDKKEIAQGTNPLLSDKKQYDIMEWSLASIAAAIKGEIEGGNLVVGNLFSVFGFLSIFWLILRFVNQRKSVV